MSGAKSASHAECVEIGLAIAKNPDLFPGEMTLGLFKRRVKELTGCELKDAMAKILAKSSGITLVRPERTTSNNGQRMQEFYRSIRERNEKNASEVAEIRAALIRLAKEIGVSDDVLFGKGG